MKDVNVEQLKAGMYTGESSSQQICDALRGMANVTPSFLLGFVTCACAGLLGAVRARCGQDGVRWVVEQLQKVRDHGNDDVEAMERRLRKGLH